MLSQDTGFSIREFCGKMMKSFEKEGEKAHDHRRVENKVNALWEIFWIGGTTNPLDVMEQMTYLIFTRQSLT